ncbi:MAG: sporulation protein [candidate division Zixibacteria bacterium]|nr:sporulation protein [candidate division Zixibacteria bacterium]
MPNKITELISSIIGELKQIATTETIIGEATKLGDKMVVPVSRVTVGFGAGGGEGEAADKGAGFGGGGGGGVRVEPVGFIVIDGDKVSFLPTKPGKFEGLIDSIPGVIEKVKSMKGKGKDKDKAEEKAEE